jgi:molybdenum-dependent DNA-binding transcriptional regulator ModE
LSRSGGGEKGQRAELEDKLRELEKRFKTEQARARKMAEERDEWRSKCMAGTVNSAFIAP